MIIYEHSHIMILEEMDMELVDYQQYILDNNFTDSEKVKYYVNWVKKFLRLKLPHIQFSRLL